MTSKVRDLHRDSNIITIAFSASFAIRRFHDVKNSCRAYGSKKNNVKDVPLFFCLINSAVNSRMF